jgi:O-antigen/teichoic acid export membrane protein
VSIRKNLLANLAGTFWTAVLNLAAVPVYIGIVGVEAYGLVGFYATIQILFSILESGLGAAGQREFARYTTDPARGRELSRLIGLLEVIYWSLAITGGIAIAASSPWLAGNWLNLGRLGVGEVTFAIALMGVAFVGRLPSLLYGGGLMGLQRQVPLNVIKASVDTARVVTTILTLWFISPTMPAFFAVQVLFELLNTALLRGFLKSYFPALGTAKGLRLADLHGVWRFASGMSGVSLLVVILTQLDKVILSKLLSLEAFAHYMIAGTLSLGLILLVRPIVSATFPKFTQLVEVSDQPQLQRVYHTSAQLMSLTIIPVALVLAFFSHEVLFVWTGNVALASNADLILTLLVLGTALNGLMSLPYALQMAYGWVKLAFYLNLGAVIVIAPLIVLMATWYGAEGAALIWLVLNAVCVLIGVWVMHRRLLPGELWKWYLVDVGRPLAAALVAVLPASVLLTDPRTRLEGTFVIVAVLLLSYLFALLASGAVRDRVVEVGHRYLLALSTRLSKGPASGQN